MNLKKFSCLQFCFTSIYPRYISLRINKNSRLLQTNSFIDELSEQEAIYEANKITSNKESKIYSAKTIQDMKKYVLMFSYLGKGYYGLQRNLDLPTVEGELLRAMYKAGIIPEKHYLDPYQMWFQKASRTDKGVSALRQIVSLFLDKNIETDGIIENINHHLPPEIRAMGIKRVPRTFDAKNNCDARRYSYTMPTLAFCPLEELCTENYRIPRKSIDKVNQILKEYEGAHNFQNFTTGREAREKGKGCFRYIMSCKCGQPFVREGVEFVIIQIKGQSFMLYQIRKMIGLVIAIMRGLANIEALRKNLYEKKIKYHMAPGLGLVLEEIFYDRYNWKFGGNGTFEPLVWDEYQESINHFKTNYIQSDIIKTEIKEKSMMKWLDECYYYSYESDDKPPSSKLFTAFIHLQKVQEAQQKMDERIIMVPNR